MWVRTQNKENFINLDNIDFIEINPLNNVICKTGDKRCVLGCYKSLDDAEQAIRKLIDYISVG